MSITPIITFKAGICEVDTSSKPAQVTPKAAPGYLYLFEEDDLIQFCWRPRAAPMSAPEIQLSMVPTDGRFLPYRRNQDSAKTNGRIFVLKFQSSSSRHLFWLQSKSQDPHGNPAFFSERDLKIGAIVDRLLQGEEVDVHAELADGTGRSGGHGDGDTEMEDARPDASDPLARGHPGQGNRAAPDQSGANAGGSQDQSSNNIPNDAATAVQNFLSSLQGNQYLGEQSSSTQDDHLFTTLGDLLTASTSVPLINSAPQGVIDKLLSNLPPALLFSERGFADDHTEDTESSESFRAALDALSLEHKRDILRRVLHSPQFFQSLGSLTQALRDGGLPTISEAMGVSVKNGGYIKAGGGVPQGGGDAVQAFVQAFRDLATQQNEATDEMNIQ